jgi:hypothetical protein
MQGKVKERWEQLCEQAAVETDSEQLIELIRDINRILYEKEQRLKANSKASGLPGQAT